MKMLVYISCLLMTIGTISAAAELYVAASYSDQQVILETISNGKRTALGSGCHNPITGMLWDCIDPETGSLGVMQVIIPSPGPDGKNVEKFVNAIVPFSHQKDKKGHLRTRHGILYISRTHDEVLVEEQKHEHVTPVIRFPILRGTGAIKLLLEISTKGSYRLTQPIVDISRPVALAPTPPADPYGTNKEKRSFK